MNFERHIDPKKALQIGQDAWAFKPDVILWEESKKEVHEWWIKLLLSGKRKYKEGFRNILLRAHRGSEGDNHFGFTGYSLHYLRDHSEYKYVLWKGIYYEL